MAKIDLLELVQEVFDEDALRQALIERIYERIDYEELANDIINNNAYIIDEMIMQLAKENYS